MFIVQGSLCLSFNDAILHEPYLFKMYHAPWMRLYWCLLNSIAQRFFVLLSGAPHFSNWTKSNGYNVIVVNKDFATQARSTMVSWEYLHSGPGKKKIMYIVSSISRYIQFWYVGIIGGVCYSCIFYIAFTVDPGPFTSKGKKCRYLDYCRLDNSW